MLGLARARAQRLGRDADLQLGDAQALSFASGSFDTVMVTLALCAVPDDRQAIREAARSCGRLDAWWGLSTGGAPLHQYATCNS
jgi:ubiquinone/menaquinone biosynthesis C-methylase UbiE